MRIASLKKMYIEYRPNKIKGLDGRPIKYSTKVPCFPLVYLQ